MQKCMDNKKWGHSFFGPHESFEECFTRQGLTLEKIIDPAILTREPDMSYKPCKCVYFKFMDQPDWILSNSEKFRNLKENQRDEELFMKHNIANNQFTGAPQW